MRCRLCRTEDACAYASANRRIGVTAAKAFAYPFATLVAEFYPSMLSESSSHSLARKTPRELGWGCGSAKESFRNMKALSVFAASVIGTCGQRAFRYLFQLSRPV